MRIISNYKDYYDFVAGYDTDPRKVYIRNLEIIDHKSERKIKLTLYHKESEFPAYKLDIFFGEVWFCDKRYPYLLDINTNNFYYDFYKIPDIINEYIEKHNKAIYSRFNNIDINDHFDIKVKKKYKYKRWGWHENRLSEKGKNLNTLNNVPVIYSRLRDKLFGEIIVNGNLEEIGFNKVKTPQEAYTEIYNFIPYIEPEMPSDPTDMGRFENKGFDKKISFRNIK